MTQRFNKGDLVQIADDLGPSMSHFTAGCEAIIIGSYSDKFGGSDNKSYTLLLKNRGESSWYCEHQLTLIKSNCLDILQNWKNEIEIERAEKSSLDWIFTHGKEVLKNPHSASIKALAKCAGIDNLWGSRGEGLTYFLNARAILLSATPFLEINDKEGWLLYNKTLIEDDKQRTT